MGGIAGLNNNTITGCEVKYIKLQVSGISNITTTQTADEKLASASHVGGIAGRNNVEIANSYVATERSNGDAGSIITARTALWAALRAQQRHYQGQRQQKSAGQRRRSNTRPCCTG